MKILGVEFAPLKIPIERRLQTLAIFYYSISFIFFGVSMLILIFYLFHTAYFFISVCYVLWFFYDHKRCDQGGRRLEWVRSLRIWKFFRDYFPVSMIKTAELDPNKNYIFGYHPHGIMCYGAFSCFATEANSFSKVFPGITPRLLTLEGQFWFPFHREYVMALGACAATKESIEWNLTREGKGNALILVVGGASEALDAHPGVASLILSRRKGFIRLALKYGACLVPVFAFGENELFDQVGNPEGSLLRKIQNKMKTILGVSTPLFHGRGVFQYNFGLLPYRKPIHVIIGKPIDVERNPDPSPEEISNLQKKYADSLTELFENHKEKYGPNVKFALS